MNSTAPSRRYCIREPLRYSGIATELLVRGQDGLAIDKFLS